MSGSRAKPLTALALLLATILAVVLLCSREPESPGERLKIDDASMAVADSGAWPIDGLSKVPPEEPDDYLGLLFNGLPTDGCEEIEQVAPAKTSRWDRHANMVELSEQLSRSDDPDLLLASALLRPDPMDRWKLLDRVLDTNPGDPVALWQKLQYCDQMDCDRQAIEAAATAFDESNGMVWLEIAGDRIRAGQWHEAEAAMRRAVTAPRFDTYVINYAVLIERGLAATTERGYIERYIYGVGVAAAMAVPSFADITRACASDENNALTWIDLCDDLGEQITRVGRSQAVFYLGVGVRRTAAKRAGDTKQFDLLSHDANQRISDLMRTQANAGAQVLAMNDPAVMQDYVENYLAHGEFDAMEMLVDDARRLRNDPEYDQCNFVSRTDLGL